MVVLSSTTNQWPPQNHMEKTNQDQNLQQQQQQQQQQKQQQQQQQQQPHLKCPRCDSSNTKFCYYNNYSLSQPRHFCKACKRYWTRGGTLRNVPVGGGCRKNKRVIKRPTNEPPPLLISSSTPPPNPTLQPHVLDHLSSTTHMTPLFYGLPTNPLSDPNTVSGFDLQSQVNVLGLGFSSNPLLESYPVLGSSTSTLASLIASSLQHQNKYNVSGNNNFQGFLPLENLQMEGGVVSKEVKMELGDQNRMDWNNVQSQNQIQQQQINSSDNNMNPYLWNSSSNIGSWLDPSVPSIL